MKSYMSIREAARETGLSEHYIREGVREGRLPFLYSGRKALVNVPLMLRKLEAKMDVEEE